MAHNLGDPPNNQSMPQNEMKITAFFLFTVFSGALVYADGSWPQWRGPNRDGSSKASTKLANAWPETGPKLLWESEPVPSGDDGGFGSVVAAGDRAYVALVWHRDVPTPTRTVDNLALRKIGARRTNLPKEVIDKMEQARIKLSPRLRGSKLDKWSQEWVNENLDAKQKLLYGDYVISRFKKGPLAFPIDATNKLYKIKDKVFPDENAFVAWLDEQKFEATVRERVIESVPPTKKVADDVIVAMDLKTGTTLWKSSLEGTPSGRTSSATPCVADGRVYALGSSRIFCVDAKTGKSIWDEKVNSSGGASSVLVEGGKVVVLANRLIAHDADTGDKLWENNDVSGKSASPVLWHPGEKPMVVCNSKNTAIGVDLDTGKTLWEKPAGGSSTPVASGEYLVAHAKDEKAGIVCYRWTDKGIEEFWKYPKVTRRSDSSPIVEGNYVFLFGAEMRLCLDLKTGKVLHKEAGKHDISSPLFADGKIFAYEIKGSFLNMVKADPNDFTELGKTKVQALRCSSPAIAGNKLLVRMVDRIACYDLGK